METFKVLAPQRSIQHHPEAKILWIILAATVGSVFEWYDFFVYGALAPFFSRIFFPQQNPVAGILASLAVLGAGFLLRPLGALVFGHLGDRFGRKYTFISTISLMGISTALIGILPTYPQVGMAAPAALVFFRLLQGLAIGGEYGGAVIYVGEHVSKENRGLFTSAIHISSSLGFLLSLVAILLVRSLADSDEFMRWGWRVPFLFSLVLLGITIYIRLRLRESPVFEQLKRAGQVSTRPIRESLLNWANLKIILISLFGASVGRTAVWYAGQLYVYYFLTATLKVDESSAALAIGAATLLALPLFVLFGWLSDHIGRKPIILSGCLLAIVTYSPIFHAITEAANPVLARAVEKTPVTLYTNEFRGTADLVWSTIKDFFGRYRPELESRLSAEARTYLSKRGIPFSIGPAKANAPLTLQIGGTQVSGFDEHQYETALTAADFPEKAKGANVNYPVLIALLFLVMFSVAAVYGPFGALMLDLFPARLRYTSLSVTYHLGTWLVGGYLAFVSTSLVVFSGDLYRGLLYPAFWAGVTVVCGLLFMRKDLLGERSLRRSQISKEF
jgi:MFS family permease